MADITKCTADNCRDLRGCYRKTAKASERQSYHDFGVGREHQWSDEPCGFFMEARTDTRKSKAVSML